MHVCRVNLGDKGMEALITLGAGDMRRTLNILQVCKTPHARSSTTAQKQECICSDDLSPCCSLMLADVRCIAAERLSPLHKHTAYAACSLHTWRQRL